MSGASEKPWFKGFKWQEHYITSILKQKGLFTNILYWKIWENGQNRIFSCFEHPKWHFLCKFHTLCHRARCQRHFRPILEHWNFRPLEQGVFKNAKNGFLIILEAKITYFHDYEPFNRVFGANFVPQLKDPSTKDFLRKFCSVNFFVP